MNDDMNAALTDEVVDDLAAFGPFFAVETHLPGSRPPPPWHPMNELIADPGALRDRVTAVGAALAAAGGRPSHAVEFRVAASVTHLGLAARILSPALAVAVTRDDLLDIGLRNTWWQPTLGGAFPLSAPRGADPDAAGHNPKPRLTPEHLAQLLASRVLNGPVRELLQATAVLSVSPRILWGNVASAVNGAASMIAARRPACAERSRMIASLLLNQPPLRGTSITTASGGFRRRSCCLIYRVIPEKPAAVCGDCVLSRDPPSLPHNPPR
ncbi:MAG TPA: (2Fe-2S)-binding protein [Pseudonocardiaceae bacterium]|nr:(2Fe-2S)-binding protein [Pseudonocardiaceae bacterium]